MGILDKLMNMGAAHLQHVEAVRAAMQTADTQAARDTLARYLQGLSEASLTGFRFSIGALMGAEQNPQVRQALQWIQSNVDALRAGQFAPMTARTLPRHGLSIEQVTSLIEPWVNLSAQEAQTEFVATMNALDGRGRQEFAGHCEVLAAQAQQQLAQMEDNENNAWGTSFEDRMAYMQARITTGQRDPAQAQAMQRQQAIIQALHQMAGTARMWQDAPPEEEPAATRSAPPSAPATSTRDGVDLSEFPSEGTQSEQMAFMRRLLDAEKSKGTMDPARAAALTDFVDGMTGYLRQEEDRQGAHPVDSQDRAAMEADLRERMSHLAGMRERVERFRDMHKDVRRSSQAPEGSRAAAVRSHVAALIDDVAGLRNSPMLAKRPAEAREMEALHMDLVHARSRLDELAASDEDVLRYEHDTLRPSAQSLRMFHRRGHVMIARPVWPGGAAWVEPSSVAFIGPVGLRDVVGQACESRRLHLREASQPGVDQATWLWRSLQRSGLAVADLTPVDHDPSRFDPLAQTYYQLGMAYALGTELLLVAREGTRIPFDVAQYILFYRDEDDLARQLPEALDATLYGVQTHGLSGLMHASLGRCRELAEKAAGLEYASVLMSQLESTVQSPLEFRAALEQFIGQMGNTRLVLLHPRWPAHYPSAKERRCFVVMPFSEKLASTQAMYRQLDDDLVAQGVEVVRGDEAVGQEIVASIWEETARASHVLVDLSDYNLNVCLELGMADAIGRDVLLIGASGTALKVFPAIEKRRVHHYGDDEASREAVRSQVKAFLQRPPTLA